MATGSVPHLDGVSRLEEWFPKLEKLALQKLQGFHSLLTRYSQALNLVSQRTLGEADRWHFADSILGGQLILPRLNGDLPLFDIGSGNGFPGVVLAILNPRLSVVLVEVDLRKIEYLKAIKNQLDLKNVTIEARPVEKLPVNSIDQAVSRGFANLSRSCLMLRKIAKSGCRYFHFKGEEWSKEVAEMPSALCSFWRVEHVGQYSLPLETTSHNIVETTRTARI